MSRLNSLWAMVLLLKERGAERSSFFWPKVIQLRKAPVRGAKGLERLFLIEIEIYAEEWGTVTFVPSSSNLSAAIADCIWPWVLVLREILQGRGQPNAILRLYGNLSSRMSQICPHPDGISQASSRPPHFFFICLFGAGPLT